MFHFVGEETSTENLRNLCSKSRATKWQNLVLKPGSQPQSGHRWTPAPHRSGVTNHAWDACILKDPVFRVKKGILVCSFSAHCSFPLLNPHLPTHMVLGINQSLMYARQVLCHRATAPAPKLNILLSYSPIVTFFGIY